MGEKEETMLLRVLNLTKRFSHLRAVNDVSFSIPEGTCFGLLGPNGAGKTTTIEIIEDIIPPTSGSIFYRGQPRTIAFRQEIGIMFQNTALLNFLSVRETLRVFRDLYDDGYDLEALMDICHLRDIQDQYNDKLSGGQRQRLLLALALVNRPRLLFLDEPSTGLDPQSRRNLWEIIETIKKDGRTIILTTHYMEEAQYLCDDVAIMDSGAIIASGSPARLIADHCRGVMVNVPKENVARLDMRLFPLPFVEQNQTIAFHTTDVKSVIQGLLAMDVALENMTVRSPNLEDVFLRLTGRRLRT